MCILPNGFLPKSWPDGSKEVVVSPIPSILLSLCWLYLCVNILQCVPYWTNTVYSADIHVHLQGNSGRVTKKSDELLLAYYWALMLVSRNLKLSFLVCNKEAWTPENQVNLSNNFLHDWFVVQHHFRISKILYLKLWSWVGIAALRGCWTSWISLQYVKSLYFYGNEH